MARSAEDCALLLGAMAAFDPRDSTSAERAAAGLHAGRPARVGARRASRSRACASACRRSSSPAALAADVDATLRAALRRSWRARRDAGRRQLPRTELSIPVYYLDRAGRGVVEPVALRRRALRPPRRALQRPRSSMYARDARRRLRRRGQAPDHDRHLRALARLLRRLLPAGAEAPPHDRRRLPGAFEQLRRDRRAGRADRRLATRRETSTTRSPDVPRRHLHAAGEPGRAAGHERSRAASAQAACRSGCSSSATISPRRTLLHAAHAFQQATDWHLRRASRKRAMSRSIARDADTRLRGRDRHRDARAALDQRRRSSAARRPRSARAPNTQASPVDLALPGTLPVLNRGAVERAIRFGLAVGAHDRAALDLRAQELLLSRPAEGLPDQPVRDARSCRAARVEFFVGERRSTRCG